VWMERVGGVGGGRLGVGFGFWGRLETTATGSPWVLEMSYGRVFRSECPKLAHSE